MLEVLCGVSGKVKEICVKPGQMITEKDVVAVIETAGPDVAVHGVAGIVKEISADVGDAVSAGALLALAT